jgi:formylglycine-generating enzyme required for sulfatase activity
VLIPAGSFSKSLLKIFQLDFDEDELDALGEEIEREREREVTISRPFYLGKYVVTQEQWTSVMGENPSHFKGLTNPVERVSWDDVQVFIQKLNEKEGTSGYRLPTEAEWEHAARAGTKTDYFFGDAVEQLDRYAWHGRNAGGKTHPVGQKEPNPWGLYDIYGNVWEWVQDWHSEAYYALHKTSVDPQGPSSDPLESSPFRGRVLRGGSWSINPGLVERACDQPDSRNEAQGLRLALSPGQ